MKKKIVFYAHSLEIGGIEKALISLLKNIDYKKYEVTLILENRIGILLKELPKQIIIKEYKISNIKFIIFRKIYNRIKLIYSIIINHNKYDFSCCYVPYSIPGSILMRYFSKKSSIWIHTDYYSLYKENINHFKAFFNNRNINKYNKIFIISNEAKDNFINIYPNLLNKVIVCGNLIEYESIKDLAKEKVKESKNDKIVFINVSRHDEESKKLTRLIKAVCNLSKDYNNFELWMIGEGEDTTIYKDLVNKYNLEHLIKFLGMKTNPYPYFKKADAFVLTSDYEGFPVVYLEALIFDLPIVTTIRTSNTFFDIKDYSILCNKSEKSIANGMKDIIESKKKFSKLNINKYNEYMLKIINKAIDGE